MSDNEDKPPAPPVRLTSCSCNRGANDRLMDGNQVELKPLPKGIVRVTIILIYSNFI